MPACSFSVFIDKVRSGEKSQTIRKGHRFKFGDMIYCKCRKGMRTPKYRALNQGKVIEVIPVHYDGHTFLWDTRGTLIRFEDFTLRDLAIRDGFADEWDMLKWFHAHYQEAFDGQVIRWIPERKR